MAALFLREILDTARMTGLYLILYFNIVADFVALLLRGDFPAELVILPRNTFLC
jgi:hypothetical protein